MIDGLRKQTAHSLRWSYGTMVTTLILQLGTTAILARFLPPEAYGVLAVTNGLLNYLVYVADMGVASVVVRQSGLERCDVWGLALPVLAGNLIIMVGLWLMAPWIVFTFGMPAESVAVLRVMAALLPLHGLNAAAGAWLLRELDFQRQGLFGIAGLLIGQGIVAATMAWAGFGIWALVAGAFVQAAIPLLLAIWRHPPCLPPRTQWGRIASMLRLGAGFSALRLLDATQAQLPALVIGACAGVTAAGLYDRGFVLSVVLFNVATGALGRVLFPLYGHLNREDPGRIADTFITALRLSLCLLCPVAAAMAVAAAPLVLTILGSTWQGVVEPLRLLLGLAVFRIIAVLAGGLVEAKGRLELHAAQRIVAITVLVVWLVAVRPTDLTSVLVAIVAIEALSALMLLILAVRAVDRTLLWGLTPLGQAAGVSASVGLAVMAALSWVDGIPPVRLAVAIAVAGLALLVTLAIHPDRSLRREVLSHFPLGGRRR